jgi:hypothetical protein
MYVFQQSGGPRLTTHRCLEHGRTFGGSTGFGSNLQSQIGQCTCGSQSKLASDPVVKTTQLNDKGKNIFRPKRDGLKLFVKETINASQFNRGLAQLCACTIASCPASNIPSVTFAPHRRQQKGAQERHGRIVHAQRGNTSPSAHANVVFDAPSAHGATQWFHPQSR